MVGDIGVCPRCKAEFEIRSPCMEHRRPDARTTNPYASPQAYDATENTNRKPASSRRYAWIFGVVGLLLGCEEHVQIVIGGPGPTMTLLCILGIVIGGRIDRFRTG